MEGEPRRECHQISKARSLARALRSSATDASFRYFSGAVIHAPSEFLSKRIPTRWKNVGYFLSRPPRVMEQHSQRDFRQNGTVS